MVFRSGYTNKTDTPLSVCISYDNEVHPRMMKPGFSYEKIWYFHQRPGVDEGVLKVTASSHLGRVSVALSAQRDEQEPSNVYDRGMVAPVPRTRRDEGDSDCFSYTDPTTLSLPTGNIRASIFVDPRTVDKLHKLSPEERDAMAPIAHPWVHSYTYVGKTWTNKVLPKLQNKSQGVNGQSSHGGRPDTRLLVQGMQKQSNHVRSNTMQHICC
ncbi:hypothetical protein BDN67DRAFT_972475 [Paxillus ammoniavirescens]|nr:hypothetical protein BDN67DRAFT_972475 [Paxillus ammoniavirescens]